MEKLNFPEYNLQIKSIENKKYIFEPIRKKWLLCTPEEWVRVHCVNYLIEDFACLSTAIKFSERSFFSLFSIIPIGIH